MNTISDFCVYSPASTANLGPGFDSLGCALNLHLKINVKVLKDTNKQNLPLDKYHIFIYQCIYYFYLRLVSNVSKTESNIKAFNTNVVNILDFIPIKFILNISNQIPVQSGLGSSASAIVASSLICNNLFKLGLSKNQLFYSCLEIESHPDNVGAAMFGHLFVPMKNNDIYDYNLLSINPDIKFLCITPNIPLSTNFSRSILPNSYSLKDIVYNIQHSISLVLSLISPVINIDIISKSLNDKIHQQYRMHYVPGLEDIFESISYKNTPGLIGVTISGSGPTVLALCYDNIDNINNKIQNLFKLKNVECKSFLLTPDYSGAFIVDDQ